MFVKCMFAMTNDAMYLCGMLVWLHIPANVLTYSIVFFIGAQLKLRINKCLLYTDAFFI